MTDQTSEEKRPKPFKSYYVTQFVELRPYEPDEDMTNIKVGDQHAREGSPQEGDYIARNPQNPDDQWLVTADGFYEHHQEAPERPVKKAPTDESTAPAEQAPVS